MDLAACYRSHGEAVLRRCRRLSASDDQARDLLQEVFLRAHKYQKTYRGGSLLSWLLTIADRTSYDAYRKRKRQPHSDIPVEELHALSTDRYDATTKRMQHDLIRKMLGRTDERTALIVIRRYFDELTYDEIAADLSINEKTVRRSLTSFLKSAQSYAEQGRAHV